jgi:hypothetical protein
MNMPIVLIVLAALAVGCGSPEKGEPAGNVPPTPAATSDSPAAEPGCEGAASAEAQCVCPDDYQGEPPCPHAAEGMPCDCRDCPEGCECRGGDKPCPKREAAEDKPES